MIGLVLRRLGQGVPTLLAVVALSFFLMRLAPGGPFDLERPLSPAAMENLRKVYGLDRPLIAQFGSYLAALARGDLGPSFSFRDMSVAGLIARGLPVSATLGALALVVACILGVGLGCVAALRRGGWIDRAIGIGAALTLSLPSFVVAPLMQIAFGLTLRWLPLSGWEAGDPRHLILPVVTLAIGTWVRPSSFVKRQSLQALIFHVATFIVFITVLVVAGGSGIIAFVRDALAASAADNVPPELPPGLGTAFLIVFLDMLFLAWTSILGLIATVRTFQGRDYRYPLIGRLF